jgi:hypothetical protein
MLKPFKPMLASKPMLPILRSLALVVAVAASGFGLGGTARGQEHRRPPQAAYDACASKSAGAACEVAMHERTLTGTCEATAEGPLACRPEHPPGPPHELTEACAGKNDGDACTAEHHDHSREGVCRRGRSGALVCLP